MYRCCLTYAIFLARCSVGEETGCEFALNEHTPKMPVITTYENPIEFLYPTNAVIRLQRDRKLRLSCVDKNFKKYAKKELTATCVRDDRVRVRFRDRYRYVQLKDLECEGFPGPAIRKIGRCYRNNTLLEIGFEIRNRFLNVFGVCFDDVEQNSIYSWYNSSKLYAGQQTGVSRVDFKHGNLYTFPVSKMYSRANQRRQFKRILKSEKLARKYVKNDNQFSLSRGHLTPKADFVYGSEQSATFQYANVAPQWQIFNGGNWFKVEHRVRNLQTNNEDRYGIITGTHDIATLPDVDNEEQSLYLAVDENDNNLLRVPKFFWKIVYDKIELTGTAIIGINNPYLTEIPDTYFLCERRDCKTVKWLKVDLTDVTEGYTYCCDMNTFLTATGYVNVFR